MISLLLLVAVVVLMADIVVSPAVAVKVGNDLACVVAICHRFLLFLR